MRGFIYVLTALAVIGLAFWAYRENYATQQAMREMSNLKEQIAQTRQAINVQRAEWAYLNRPSRLRELADLNYRKLELMPLNAIHYGRLEQIAYPSPVLPEITDQMEVRGTISEATP